MKVIGLGRRTQGLAGWGLITTDSDSLTVTGRENTAGSNMITVGITTETAISGNMTEAEAMTATGIMIATETMIGIGIMTAKAITIASFAPPLQTV